MTYVIYIFASKKLKRSSRDLLIWQQTSIVNRHVICSTTFFNNIAKPLMFLVSGKHTTSHMYRAGQDLTVDCQVVGLPVPTVTWSHGQQLITPSARREVVLRMTAEILLLYEHEFQNKKDQSYEDHLEFRSLELLTVLRFFRLFLWRFYEKINS